jgi:hypothetical protein
MRDLCWACKSFKEIAYTEVETKRPFCQGCLDQQPLTSEQKALIFLMLTIPFKPGDRVKCHTAGGTPVELYDGIGTVQEISTDIERGCGTMVYPTFRVKIEEKQYPSCPDEIWFCENGLRKLTEKEAEDFAKRHLPAQS